MTLSQETRKDINDSINENTDRIVKLVNKMLELSDANTQTEIPCDDDVSIAQIVTQAIENAQVENLPNVAFETLMGEEHEKTFIHTNMDAAARALRLLLDNAKKFTKEGKISLFVDYQKTTVNFVVEDTGIGVPTEEAEHIFEEFVQLDTFYDGTGIGLTVARSIARRLGGDIWLDTSYSQGARFVYSLPVNTDES
jgi:signal transduction histidine kinase